MKEYIVALSRAYLVTIEAESVEKARRFSEFYLGYCPDLSTARDRKEKRFQIHDIKMTINDAIDVLQEDDEE